jgi:hypothetical protein
MFAVNTPQAIPDTSLSWIFILLLIFMVLTSVIGALTDRARKRAISQSQPAEKAPARQTIAQKAGSSLRKLKSRSGKNLK